MPDIKLPLEDDHRPVLKEQFQKHFKGAKTAWDCASLLIVPGIKVGVGKGEFISLCMVAAYVKMMRLFYSIYRLCERGLGDESNLQLRTMLELYARLKYIATNVEDKNEFARRWGLWCMANDDKFFDAVGKHFPGSTEANVPNWRGIVKEEKERLGEKWGHFLKAGPWEKNVYELCQVVGLEKSYPMYSLLSGTEHAYDLFRYARKIGEDATEMDMTPLPRVIDQNLSAAVSILHDSLVVINSELGLGKDQVVEDVGRMARSLMAS